jgi:arylsulfatase
MVGSRRFSVLLLASSVALASGCGLLGRPRAVVLLITVDTLRADHLGAYGNTLGLTPQLDRLAAESVLFEAAYAPASFTLPSLSSLMTSRYPEEVGVTSNSTILARDVPSLASWYAGRGFATGGVVSNFVLRKESGFDRGFERYDATFPGREAVRAVPERVAPDSTAAALRSLDELRRDRKPVFLWVHYQDPHGPYAPPQPLRARYLAHEQAAPDARRELPVSASVSGTGAIPKYQYLEGHRDPAFYRAGYAGEVATVDEAIGALLDGVRQRGLMEHATVVFASDHGEGLGEDDYWFAHGERLTDPLVRVPLIVRVPGRPASRRSEVVSLLDVFPTLAALAGGTPPADARGRDLLAPNAAAHPASIYMSTLTVSDIPRAGLVSRGFRYLVEANGPNVSERLFKLGDERRDVSTESPEALKALRAELMAARESLRKAGTNEQAVSPEDQENFKALGYVTPR